MRVFLAALLLLALPAVAGEWKTIGVYSGTKVERLNHDEGPPTIRCTHVFDEPMEVMTTVLTSFEWDKWMNDVHTYKVISRDDDARRAVLYGRHKTPWPIAHRDYVIQVTWEETPDTFVLQTRGLKGVGPKTPKGVVRLMPRGTWDFRREGAKTRFIYTYRAGAGGNIPLWMLEGSYKSEGPNMIKRWTELVARRRR